MQSLELSLAGDGGLGEGLHHLLSPPFLGDFRELVLLELMTTALLTKFPFVGDATTNIGGVDSWTSWSSLLEMCTTDKLSDDLLFFRS